MSRDASPPLRTVPIDDAARSALVGAFTRYSLTRPPMLVFAVLLAALVVYQVVVTVVAGTAPVVLTILPIALLLALPLVTWFALRRSVVRAYPPGTTIGVAVGQDRLTVETPLARGELAYSAYRSITAMPRVVVLQTKTRIAQLFPRSVFTDDEIPLLRSRIGGGS